MHSSHRGSAHRDIKHVINRTDADRQRWNSWRKRTHLQHAATAQGERLPVGQMFHHLRRHNGVERPRPLPSVYFLLRRELLQRAGPVADQPPEVWIVGRVEPSRADAVFHRVNAQNDCAQASERLREEEERRVRG